MRVAVVLELILASDADLVHHVVQPFDDVEGIDADLSVGEVLFRNRNKAIAHITAEVSDLPALFRRKPVEIPVYGSAGDLLQDVNDGVDIAIGDAALKFAEPPSMVFGTPDAAVSFEFIDADGFREFPGQAEVHCLKDRLDDGWCNAVLPGNRREREGFREIQKNGIVEGLCHMQGGMNPAGVLVESGAACFAVEPAFVERDGRTPVVGRDMANGLPGAGILDDTVDGSAVRTETLPWGWKVQGNEIIVPESLDMLDGCFLRKFC